MIIYYDTLSCTVIDMLSCSIFVLYCVHYTIVIYYEILLLYIRHVESHFALFYYIIIIIITIIIIIYSVMLTIYLLVARKENPT